MKKVGPHVSTAGGVHNAPLNAHALGAKAFALFTKNQRRWAAKPLEDKVVDAFKSNLRACDYIPDDILPHGSYLLNIGHPDPQIRSKSIDALIDEAERCALLGVPWLNIHPGSHLGAVSEEQCLKTVSDSINRVLSAVSGCGIVIETTAGQGGSVGYQFDHLARILDGVEDRLRCGICIDTCHIFAAGYDITTISNYERVMKELDSLVGREHIRGAHLNDCKTTLGSRVDRHESIAKGNIGETAFRCLMNDERFEDIPLVLETIDAAIWREEIELLYSFCA
ncbi:deoxyribonuclease IV [Chitinispirillales bacterium ANBcel5]|uniref:deoxyribonuclease IV n=1 Tax=Cellulosispirillum alkaliphilum TaxID=3039283 RepID=UPI002A504018|nr:deoxyribonuclease IV [Chitinispirillales bacterium ANBcel5]